MCCWRYGETEFSIFERIPRDTLIAAAASSCVTPANSLQALRNVLPRTGFGFLIGAMLHFLTVARQGRCNVMNIVLDIHVHHIHIGGMKTLADHMDETGTTDAALAALVKCDRSMITKIRNRQATPSLPLALAISKTTGVQIEALMPETAQ